jgi:predicted transcriptional regulator
MLARRDVRQISGVQGANSDMAANRAIMRIQLDSSAKAELDKICDKRGMTQIAVMSRLVGWFVKQDEVIQTAVMATLTDGAMAQLAKQILKKASSERSGEDAK